MILTTNPCFHFLIIQEAEKKTLPFPVVCDLISHEDKPFLRGSKTVALFA